MPGSYLRPAYISVSSLFTYRSEVKQMIVTDLEDLTEQEVLPGFRAKFVHSENVTVSYWTVKAGAALPEHAHPHEQITNKLEGTFEMVVDGEPQTLKATWSQSFRPTSAIQELRSPIVKSSTSFIRYARTIVILPTERS
jgi:hypothetical protein